jgi:hypothetical protein
MERAGASSSGTTSAISGCSGGGVGRSRLRMGGGAEGDFSRRGAGGLEVIEEDDFGGGAAAGVRDAGGGAVCGASEGGQSSRALPSGLRQCGQATFMLLPSMRSGKRTGPPQWGQVTTAAIGYPVRVLARSNPGGVRQPRKRASVSRRSVAWYASRTHSTILSGSGEYSSSILIAPSIPSSLISRK